MTCVARRTDGVVSAMTGEVRAYLITSAMHDFRGTTAVISPVMTGANGKTRADGATGAYGAVSGRPRTCTSGRMQNSAGTVVVMDSVASKIAGVVRKSSQGQLRESGT
jgi:hypothetical protein